jgi:hypothetical protein
MQALLDHLLLVKLRHWDKAVRALAAMGLAALAPVAAPQLATSSLVQLLDLITDDVLEVRCGAVLAIAELLPALAAAQQQQLDTGVGLAVVQVLDRLEAAGCYKGKGGELMREMAARLVQQVAAATAGLQVVPLYGGAGASSSSSRRHKAEQDMERQQQQDSRAESPAADVSDAGSDEDSADEAPLQQHQHQQQQQQQLMLPLTADFHASALRLLVDCISHVQDSIQAAGVAALQAHAAAFQQQERQELLQVVAQCCRRLSDREVAAAAARKGAAAALGVLPAGLLGSTAEDVLGVLVAAVQVMARNSLKHFPWPLGAAGQHASLCIGCMCGECNPQVDILQSRANMHVLTAKSQVMCVSACAAALQEPLDPMAGFVIEVRNAAVSSLSQLTQELISSSTSQHGSSARAGNTGAAAAAAAANGDVPNPVVSVEFLQRCVLPALTAALRDYTRDNRGDVGSWVREAAMDGTTQLLLLLSTLPKAANAAAESGQAWASAEAQALYNGLAVQLVGQLLQQSLERIARLRESALINLQTILRQPAAAAAVPGAAAIAAALPGDAAELAGVASLACVPRLGALLQLPWYRRPVLEGLVASIGGVDASLSKEASAALLAQVSSSSTAVAGHGTNGGSSSKAELHSSVAGLLLQLWQEESG